MRRLLWTATLLSLGLTLLSCRGPATKPLVDPFPLRFPLVKAGELPVDGRIAGQPWADDGIVYYRTGDGQVTAVVASSRIVLSRSGADQSIQERPVQAGTLVFKRDEAILRAMEGQGRTVWVFKAKGIITAEPAVAEGRVLFGDSERTFYCLDAATGKVRWRRRLQGVPVHPAVAGGGAVAFPASNSVVYRLSLGGGSILSWEAVPSRVVYELTAAGPFALITSASPAVTALDLRTGTRTELTEASGPLVAGAVWTPPYVVFFVEDEDSGRQKIVFLRSK